MGVSLKTENEEQSGKTLRIRGQRRRAARFHRHLHARSSMAIPRQPSARLTRGLERATAQRPLRFSVLRETPMTSAIDFKKLKCYQPLRRASADADMLPNPLGEIAQVVVVSHRVVASGGAVSQTLLLDFS